MDPLERLEEELDQEVGKTAAGLMGVCDMHTAEKVSILTAQQVRHQQTTAILAQANASLEHVLSLCQVHAN